MDFGVEALGDHDVKTPGNIVEVLLLIVGMGMGIALDTVRIDDLDALDTNREGVLAVRNDEGSPLFGFRLILNILAFGFFGQIRVQRLPGNDGVDGIGCNYFPVLLQAWPSIDCARYKSLELLAILGFQVENFVLVESRIVCDGVFEVVSQNCPFSRLEEILSQGVLCRVDFQGLRPIPHLIW